jgi:outer membrane cobalamin receptor
VSRTTWQYGSALEYEARPADRLGLTAGLVYHRLEGEGLDDDAAGASLGAFLELTPTSRVRGSYAHRFRFPTLRQLFDASAGNPTLDTETADVTRSA